MAQNHLGLRYISLIEVEIKNRGNFCGRFRNNVYRECTSYNQILEVDIELTLTVEETMLIIPEAVRDIGIVTMITGETITRGQGYDRNRSRSLDRKDRSRRRDRSVSNGRSRSGSRASTNRDKIRCFECREYDHFERECLTR